MSDAWRHLPAGARTIALATSDAVEAAQRRDPDAYVPAVASLAALDPQPVGVVLGGVVRLLLEDLHPHGLVGDDVRVVLDRCVRSAARWQPDVEPHTVLVLLAGALGVQDPDERDDRPDAHALARHAPLLIADLLSQQVRPLGDYLGAALGEVERRELHD